MVRKVKQPPVPRSDRPEARKVEGQKHPAPSKARSKTAPKSKTPPDALSILGDLARSTFTTVARAGTVHLIAGATIAGFAAKKIQEVAEPVVRHVRHGYQKMKAAQLEERARSMPAVFGTMAGQLAQALAKDSDKVNLDATGEAMDNVAFFVGKYEQLGRLSAVSDMDPQTSERYQAAWAKAVEGRDGRQLNLIHRRHVLIESVGAMEGVATPDDVPKALKDAAKVVRKMAGDLDDPLVEDDEIPKYITAAGAVTALVQTHRASDHTALGSLAQTARIRDAARTWVLGQVQNPETLFEDGAEKIAQNADTTTTTLYTSAILAESKYVNPASRDGMLSELEKDPASKRSQVVRLYTQNVLVPREQAMSAWKQLHPSMGFRDARHLEYAHEGWGGVSSTVLNDNPITQLYRQWKTGNPYEQADAKLARDAARKFIDRFDETPLEPEPIVLAGDADWDRFARQIDIDAKDLGGLTRLLGKAASLQRPAEEGWKDQFIRFKLEANYKIGVEGRAGAHITGDQAMRGHYKPEMAMLLMLSEQYPRGIPRKFAEEQLAVFRAASPDSPAARGAATIYEQYLYQEYQREQHGRLVPLAGRDNPDKDVRARAQMLEIDFAHDKYYWMDAKETAFAPAAKFSDKAEAIHRDVARLEGLRSLEEMRLSLEGKGELIQEYGHSKSAAGKALFITGGWIAERWRAAGLVGARVPDEVSHLLFEIAKARHEVQTGEVGRLQMLTQVQGSGRVMQKINALAEEAAPIVAARDMVQDIAVMAVSGALTAGVGAELQLALRSQRAIARVASLAQRVARLTRLPTQFVEGVFQGAVKIAIEGGKQASFVHSMALQNWVLRGHQDLYDFKRGVRFNVFNAAVQVTEFGLMGRAHHWVRGSWKVAQAARHASKVRTALSWVGSKSHEFLRDTVFFHTWSPLGTGVRSTLHAAAQLLHGEEIHHAIAPHAEAMKQSIATLGSWEAFRHTLIFTVGLGVPLGQPLQERVVKFALEHRLPEMRSVAARQGKIAAIETQIGTLAARGVGDASTPGLIAELRRQQQQLAAHNEKMLEALTKRHPEAEELKQQVMVLHHAHGLAQFNLANARHAELSHRLEAAEVAKAPVAKRLRALRVLEAHAQKRAAIANHLHSTGALPAEAAMATRLEAQHIRNQRLLAENGAKIHTLERALTRPKPDASHFASHVARLALAYQKHIALMEEANALVPECFPVKDIEQLRQRRGQLLAAMPELEGQVASEVAEATEAAEALHREQVLALEAQARVVRDVVEAEAASAKGKSEKPRLDPFATARQFVAAWREAFSEDVTSPFRRMLVRAMLLPVAPLFGAVGPVDGGGGRREAALAARGASRADAAAPRPHPGLLPEDNLRLARLVDRGVVTPDMLEKITMYLDIDGVAERVRKNLKLSETATDIQIYTRFSRLLMKLSRIHAAGTLLNRPIRMPKDGHITIPDYDGYPFDVPITRILDPAFSPSHRQHGAKIEIDVGVIDGHVWEIKTYPETNLGRRVQSYNQALKFQRAIELGRAARAAGKFNPERNVDGATVEVSGNVSPSYIYFLKANAPDVELLYAIRLPDGHEVVFPLVEATSPARTLARIEPNTGLTAREQAIVLGIKRRIELGTLLDVLTSDMLTQEDILNSAHARALQDASENGRVNPEKITDVAVLREFERLSLEKRIRLLEETGEAPRIYRSMGVFNVPITDAVIDHELDKIRSFLQSAAPFVRDKYLTNIEADPALWLRVRSEFAARMRNVAALERDRIANESEEVRDRRRRLGYSGPRDGFPLDPFHFYTDVVRSIVAEGNQDSRDGNYAISHTFPTALDVARDIRSGKYQVPRTTITVYYPAGTSEDVASTAILDVTHKPQQRAILMDNIAKANLNTFSNLRSNPAAGSAIIQKLDRAASRIQRVHTRLLNLRADRREAINLAKTPDDKRAAGLSFAPKIDAARQKILDTYRSILGEKDFDRFAVRILSDKTDTLTKFVYVVEADGTMRLCEESVKASTVQKNRPTHSTLAGGRNVYAAGEMFVRGLDVVVINNGSGHYRPGAPEHLAYVRNLLKKNGFNILDGRGSRPATRLEHVRFPFVSIESPVNELWRDNFFTRVAGAHIPVLFRSHLERELSPVRGASLEQLVLQHPAHAAASLLRKLSEHLQWTFDLQATHAADRMAIVAEGAALLKAVLDSLNELPAIVRPAGFGVGTANLEAYLHAIDADPVHRDMLRMALPEVDRRFGTHFTGMLESPKVKSQYVTPSLATTQKVRMVRHPSLSHVLDALWADSTGGVEIRDDWPTIGTKPEEMPKALKMLRTLVETRARELGVTPNEVCVTIAGPGLNASEVVMWLRAGARVHVVEPGQGIISGLLRYLGRVGVSDEERSRLTTSDQKMDATTPATSDITVWNYPRRTLTDDNSQTLEPRELSLGLKPGGLLVVQSDFPETYVDPFSEGGAYAREFDPVFRQPMGKSDFLLPSTHLAVASTLGIFRMKFKPAAPETGGTGGGGVGPMPLMLLMAAPMWVEGARNLYARAAPKVGRAARAVAGAVRGWLASAGGAMRALGLPAPKVKSQDLTPSPRPAKVAVYSGAPFVGELADRVVKGAQAFFARPAWMDDPRIARALWQFNPRNAPDINRVADDYKVGDHGNDELVHAILGACRSIASHSELAPNAMAGLINLFAALPEHPHLFRPPDRQGEKNNETVLEAHLRQAYKIGPKAVVLRALTMLEAEIGEPNKYRSLLPPVEFARTRNVRRPAEATPQTQVPQSAANVTVSDAEVEAALNLPKPYQPPPRVQPITPAADDVVLGKAARNRQILNGNAGGILRATHYNRRDVTGMMSPGQQFSIPVYIDAATGEILSIGRSPEDVRSHPRVAAILISVDNKTIHAINAADHKQPLHAHVLELLRQSLIGQPVAARKIGDPDREHPGEGSAGTEIPQTGTGRVNRETLPDTGAILKRLGPTRMLAPYSTRLFNMTLVLQMSAPKAARTIIKELRSLLKGFSDLDAYATGSLPHEEMSILEARAERMLALLQDIEHHQTLPQPITGEPVANALEGYLRVYYDSIRNKPLLEKTLQFIDDHSEAWLGKRTAYADAVRAFKAADEQRAASQNDALDNAIILNCVRLSRRRYFGNQDNAAVRLELQNHPEWVVRALQSEVGSGLLIMHRLPIVVAPKETATSLLVMLRAIESYPDMLRPEGGPPGESAVAAYLRMAYQSSPRNHAAINRALKDVDALAQELMEVETHFFEMGAPYRRTQSLEILKPEPVKQDPPEEGAGLDQATRKFDVEAQRGSAAAPEPQPLADVVPVTPKLETPPIVSAPAAQIQTARARNVEILLGNHGLPATHYSLRNFQSFSSSLGSPNIPNAAVSEIPGYVNASDGTIVALTRGLPQVLEPSAHLLVGITIRTFDPGLHPALSEVYMQLMLGDLGVDSPFPDPVRQVLQKEPAGSPLHEAYRFAAQEAGGKIPTIAQFFRRRVSAIEAAGVPAEVSAALASLVGEPVVATKPKPGSLPPELPPLPPPLAPERVENRMQIFPDVRPIVEGVQRLFARAAPKVGRAARAVAGAVQGWVASTRQAAPTLPAPKVKSQDLTPRRSVTPPLPRPAAPRRATPPRGVAPTADLEAVRALIRSRGVMAALDLAIHGAYTVFSGDPSQRTHDDFSRDPFTSPHFAAFIGEIRAQVEQDLIEGRGRPMFYGEGPQVPEAAKVGSFLTFNTIDDFDTHVRAALKRRTESRYRTPPQMPRIEVPVAPVRQTPPRGRPSAVKVSPDMRAHLARFVSGAAGGRGEELPSSDDAMPPPSARKAGGYKRYVNEDADATVHVDLEANRDRWQRAFEDTVRRHLGEAHFYIPGPEAKAFFGSWVWGGTMELEEPDEFMGGGDVQGRIYLSLRSGNVGDSDDSYAAMTYVLLTRMARAAAKRGHPFSFKVTNSPGNLKRADSAVIYFGSKDQQHIYNMLVQLSAKGLFKPSIPAFTAQVYSPDGTPMTGIAFGQSPPGKGSSFGSKRAAIIDRVLAEVEDEKRGGAIFTEEEIMLRIAAGFQRAGIDINHPAFEDNGREIFDFIYHRSTMSGDDETPTVNLPLDEPKK